MVGALAASAAQAVVRPEGISGAASTRRLMTGVAAVVGVFLVSLALVAAASAQTPAPLGALGEEDVSARTATARSYQIKDGTTVTRLSASPVNFREASGAWRSIDSTLVREADGDLGNRANSFDVQLPSRLSDEPVKLDERGDSVGFSLRGASAAQADASGAEVRYAEALPGVDVIYEAGSNKLKETLRLRDLKAAGQPFVFDFSVSAGLTPYLLPTGAVEVRDADGKVEMLVAAPFMADAAGRLSSKVDVALDRVASGWRMTLAPDRAWLAGDERSWPVDLDPTIYPSADQDCSISEFSGEGSLCTAGYFQAGYSSGQDHRGLVRFNFGTAVPGGSEILAASMGLNVRSQSTTDSKTFSVLPLTQGFTGAASWNRYDGVARWTTAGGDFDAAAGSDQLLGFPGSAGWQYWDVRAMVTQWLRGERPNHGVVVKDNGSRTVQNTLTINSNNSSSVPFIDVRHSPRIGQRAGYRVETQRLSDRISLGVNVASGNLLVRQTDLQLPGGLGPALGFSRSYNSLQTNKFSLGGAGWTLDSAQDVRIDSLGAAGAVLTGPTGYHAKFTGQSYSAPLGLNVSLKRETSNGWTLTDNPSQQKLSFGSDGRLSSIADRNGRRIEVHYPAGDAKADTLTDARGKVTTLAYDASARLSKLTDPAGRSTTYTYDAAGQLASTTDAAAKTTFYGYETSGRLNRITTPGGRLTTIAYYADSAGTNAKRVKSVTRVTDPATGSGPTTSYDYVVAPDGSGTSTIVDPRQNQTKYTFDVQGRPTQVTDALGRQSDTNYNSAGFVNTYKSPAATVGASGPTTKINYSTDGLNNPIGTEAPTGSGNLTTSAAFGEGGSVAASTPGAAYLPTSSVNEQGRMSRIAYSAGGNPSSISRMASDGSVKSDVRLEYDPNSPGRLTGTRDGNNNLTSYEYTPQGDVSRVTPPLPRGATTLSYGANSGQDASLGRLSTVTDGDGRTRSFSYDALDRITKITYGDTSTDTITYDADGNLTQRVDATGTTALSYDARNLLLSESLPGGRTNTYAYDSAGNLTSVADAGGKTDYAYDQINRQSKIFEPGNATPFAFAYDPASKFGRSVTMPNGVKVLETRNDAGQLLDINATNSAGTVLRRFSYTYAMGTKPVALRTSMTATNGDVTTYQYDELDRLSSSDAPATSAALVGLAYDGASNLITKLERPANSSVNVRHEYMYNAANQLCWKLSGSNPARGSCEAPPAGTPTASYDREGNETRSISGRTTTYNARNQVASMTTSGGTVPFSFAGDGQANLVGMNGKTFTSNALGVSAEKDGGSATSYYTRDENGQLLGQRTSSGGREYPLWDGLGSIRALTNTSGAVTSARDYNEFGQSTPGGTVDRMRFRYAGGLSNDDGNITQFGQRFYEQGSSMRWTQPDPLNQPSDLRQANRYAYVGGDPINLLDPSGTCVDVKGVGGTPASGGTGTCSPEYGRSRNTATTKENACALVAIAGVALSFSPAGRAVTYLSRGGAIAGLTCA